MKVGFISADNGGSAFYRVIQPFMICKKLYDEVYYSPAGRVTYKLVNNSDVILIQRQEANSALEGMAKQIKHGKILLTDIDDNIWSVPKDVIEMRQFWTKDKIQGFERTLKICHAVTTSTPFLAKIIKRFNKNVFVVPNLVNSFEFSKPENRAIRIGWGGSTTHLPDFTPEFISVLLKLKKEYKDKIELVMMGITPLELIGHSTFYRFIDPYKYLAFIRAVNLDIAIIPCANNFFNDARSNVKFLEWSAIKAATVSAPATSYLNCIEHGITGFFAKKTNQWYEYLKLLIEDVDLRKKIGQNAFNYTHENYSVEKKSGQYNIYKELFERSENGDFHSDPK